MFSFFSRLFIVCLLLVFVYFPYIFNYNCRYFAIFVWPSFLYFHRCFFKSYVFHHFVGSIRCNPFFGSCRSVWPGRPGRPVTGSMSSSSVDYYNDIMILGFVENSMNYDNNMLFYICKLSVDNTIRQWKYMKHNTIWRWVSNIDPS